MRARMMALGAALLLWGCNAPLESPVETLLSASATLTGNLIEARVTISNVSTHVTETTYTCSGVALKVSDSLSAQVVWYDLRDPRRGLSFERACTLLGSRVTLAPDEEISPPELRSDLLLEEIPESLGSATWYVWLGFWLDGEERFLYTGLVIEL